MGWLALYRAGTYEIICLKPIITMKKIALACLLMLAIFSCTKQDKPINTAKPNNVNATPVQLTMDKAENIRRVTQSLENVDLPADKKREMIEDMVAMVNYDAKPPANARVTTDDVDPVPCAAPSYASGYVFQNLLAPANLLFNPQTCTFDWPQNVPGGTPCAAKVLNKPMAGGWSSTLIAYHLTVNYTMGQSVYTGQRGCN